MGYNIPLFGGFLSIHETIGYIGESSELGGMFFIWLPRKYEFRQNEKWKVAYGFRTQFQTHN